MRRQGPAWFCGVSAAIGLLAANAIAAPDPGSIVNARAHIKHLIFIIQENRSFDQYFGTFPGADGIPANVCMPLDPANPDAGCVVPFHNQRDVDSGGPHYASSAVADLDDGVTKALMNGFVNQQIVGIRRCASPNPLVCVQNTLGLAQYDVMGYHTADDIPNYWAYAKNFVLQDHFFEGTRSWSLPSHLDMTSEWSALCTNNLVASTCSSALPLPEPGPTTTYPWVNLFQLLDNGLVSWKYYVSTGFEPDCDDGAMSCAPVRQSASMPSAFNPAQFFTSVQAQGAAYLAAHNPSIDQFFADIQGGTLPAVAWIVPSNEQSEHPPNAVTMGMEFTTSLVNAVASSPYWNDTAIFIAWDDWGGFYDHVVPPNVDSNTDAADPVQGFGLRVPSILVSAYARTGLVDHHVLSMDSYATLIEDLFLNGIRLNPTALGNPDNRPDLRDSLRRVKYLDGTTAFIGNLVNDFDFQQRPRPPLLLPADIPTTLLPSCGATPTNPTCQSTTVTLAWSALTSAQGAAPFTYHVVRDTPPVAVCATPGTSCTDMPGSGAHFYRAYAVDASGVASPLSAAVEADEP